ncbi:hypothetical protein DPMN_163084 [Dreissena polymorpha]|uniref:Uncharacterized protein n=1 Tax=Dreissena polymorpha TaxID=45954 RepID=A0A9D4IU94_DREPO|nr:hypothetical protein DPMN_163084 [Dreissena polymorpha]
MQKQRKRKQVAAFPQITRLGPPHPEKAANRPLTSVVYLRETVVDNHCLPSGP